MPANPLDDLIDDIKSRPVPYAAVAAIGVAAAVVLATRALQDDRSHVRNVVDRTADSVKEHIGNARDRLPDADDLSGVGERVSHVASQAGISQSTVAVFIGTLLTKGVTGWLKRQDAQAARSQGAALSEASGRDFNDHLHDMTVAELREVAADREVSGRSTMNKDELVDALANG